MRITEDGKGKGADEEDWRYVYRNPVVAPPDPRMWGIVADDHLDSADKRKLNVFLKSRRAGHGWE